MAFIYAILIGGAICAVTQALSELKIPFPLIAIIMTSMGGILSIFGVIDLLNGLAAGGAGVTALGCGSGAFTAGQTLALAGVPIPLIICVLLNVALVAMGAACGM